VNRPIILLHGGWHGGWWWRLVADQLAAAGHRVYTPTLTGLGERAHLFTPELGIDTHVKDLQAVIQFERLYDVVLVGHSYGGVITTLVADADPERIAALVYVDAMVPEDGCSDWDRFPKERREAMRVHAASLGGDRVPVPDPALWRVEDPVHLEWLHDCCTPHPLRPIQQAPSLTSRWLQVKHKLYILASDRPDPRFAGFHRRFSSEPSWETAEIHGGHELMLSHPDELSSLVLAAARQLN
jgi:pimeloyl-ACP methyl ester carboxylesterase